MNPAECGPVNDLKSLGGRLDVDGRARRVSVKGLLGVEGYTDRELMGFNCYGHDRTASFRTISMALRDHRDKLFR
jgi:hypothetical protein